jgi:CelD/BcsL family acetyltransferase involved in cellulose biosynthesis
MCRVDTFKARKLPPEHRHRWIAALTHVAHPSPLLHPDFALHVARNRRDVRILVARDEAGRAAYLALHKAPCGFTRPVGAVFSDYHGIVAEPGFQPRIDTVLGAAGLRAFRYFSMLPSGTDRGTSDSGHQRGVYASLAQGDPSGIIRQNKPSRAKQYGRLDRKLEREHGEISLTLSDEDPSAFDTVLAWKSAQFRASGRHDVLRTRWIRNLLDDVRLSRDGAWQGRLVTLRAGGELVAAEFGPFWNGIFHPWIAAYNNAYAPFSPGHLLVRRLLESMQADDINRYDLGADDAPYKAGFANGSVALFEGLATARSGDRPVRFTQGQSLLHKSVRRWEQILLAEPTFAGRMGGLAGATRALLVKA